MSLKTQTSVRLVLYEGRGASALAADQRYSLLVGTLEKGHGVTRATGQGSVAPSDRTTLLVVGAFDSGAMPESSEGTDGSRTIFKQIDGSNGASVATWLAETRAQSASPTPGEWKPWFPVIDYDRCTNCMQCLSFCLFGVYGVDGGHKIQVQNNDSCKTNCPACSRVCPEAAIMFPKYKAGPINGDIVSQADLQREKMKIDISSLLGGDIYSLLRERSEKAKSRFSKERDADKALTERQKCLTKLAQSGDIPAEVLMSLPSPEEILRRAEEAKSKAQAALEAQPGFRPTPLTPA